MVVPAPRCGSTATLDLKILRFQTLNPAQGEQAACLLEPYSFHGLPAPGGAVPIPATLNPNPCLLLVRLGKGYLGPIDSDCIKPSTSKTLISPCHAQGEPRLPATAADFCLPPELMRDRQPVYEMVRRNLYSARRKPKRMQRDDIDVCTCAPVPVVAPAEGEPGVVMEVIKSPAPCTLRHDQLRRLHHPDSAVHELSVRVIQRIDKGLLVAKLCDRGGDVRSSTRITRTRRCVQRSRSCALSDPTFCQCLIPRFPLRDHLTGITLHPWSVAVLLITSRPFSGM